jgi:hypothetical protein
MLKKLGLVVLLVLLSAGYVVAQENSLSDKIPCHGYIVTPSYTFNHESISVF